MAAGHPAPPPEVLAHIEANERSLTQLEELAALVGCPHSWLHYARKAGERGEPAHQARPFQSPDKVPRRTVRAVLGQHIHQLQDSAGVLAAHTARHHHRLDSEERAHVQAVVGVRWQRLGAVSHELALTGRERDRLWSRHGSRHWASIVANQMDSLTDQQLDARFHTLAGANFSHEATPLVVLLQSGIGLHDIATQMPHSADEMVELVDVALDAMARATDAGCLNDAVTAATLTEHPTEHSVEETGWSPAEPDAVAWGRDPGVGP